MYHVGTDKGPEEESLEMWKFERVRVVLRRRGNFVQTVSMVSRGVRLSR